MRNKTLTQCAKFSSKKSLVKTLLKKIHPTLLFLLLSVFAINFYASPQSSEDISIDPNFNVQIRTNSFGSKFVGLIKILPDDKILASGHFNTYNGQPVSGFVRLNPDGSLDPTFNNNLFAANSFPFSILLLNDGKILVSGNFTLSGQTQPTSSILRLNADGSIDPTFNYNVNNNGADLAIDSSGRILLRGSFQVTEDGAPVSRFIIRLNADGSHDPTFRFNSNTLTSYFGTQNNKVIVASEVTVNDATQHIIYRVNEDGSNDSTFAKKEIGYAKRLIVQPDNKILFLTDSKMIRLNENGDNDTGFQVTNIARPPCGINLNNDGRITVCYGNSTSEGFKFIRLMPNGAADPSFSVFTYSRYFFGAQAIQANGSILIGDNHLGFSSTVPTSGNGFIRLQPNGLVDSGFNPGGTGFLNSNPGNTRSIAIQTDDKIIIAGRFDKVGDVFRSKIFRLNSDTTLDNSFQINTGGIGNYFSQLNEIYNVRLQTDGKLIITGNFKYLVNGVEKINIARLNTDGSIDSSFAPSLNINDYFGGVNGGTNRFVFQTDGKIVVGASRNGSTSALPVALRLNTNGNLDNAFNSPAYTSQNAVYILDIAIQPDGKILIGGRYQNPNINNDFPQSFLARLNSDGSIDQTFQMPEEANSQISTFKLLENGKILIAKLKGVHTTAPQSTVHRLNSNGSVDASFDAGLGTNGKLNALLLLPNGKIMVGGKFSTFNGQQRANLVKLNGDGNLDPTIYSLNEEVFYLTLDNQQRILVGGNFTTIGIGNGQNVSRSFAARLIEANLTTGKTRFDFDGDGQADLATFAQSTGDWSILRSSQTSQPLTTKFGINGDKTAAADFDGDGKTDIAVYRPAEGNWYLLQSTAGFTAFRWGAAEDKPVPADYDGDGKADIAVWRPSSGSWFIYQSSNSQLFAVNFGLADDIALTDADFDGDEKADIAVWRPSNGTFYWLASASNNQFNAIQFGQNGDIPAVADYNSDGKADFVVFRPSTGVWFQNLTSANGSLTFSAVHFGQDGDQPVAADYDGDGKTDIAVRRQGFWYLLKSGQGYSGISFGNANTQAVAALPN